ncbi:hypothetical protein [Jannaschia seohaensis]|uniref:Uncharacterized protein n=1 Tax=Jannaschia seohaensis TaxID=475081 RepID=A0A2Y9B6M9_9RHOB|nr:hypothetical protein [Jannaschia seohaensis]PWJ10325.1 hypothetical protein BCF38_1243 [Jannaschia seohaensis]SSA51725.1 hypothetical protein SAMN05421539_1243 [Jannaschia seohaensis]
MKPLVKMTSAVAFLVGSACTVAAADEQAMIADARSAAPDAISMNATIMDWEGNTLQQGSNGFTCFPTPPTLNGTAPMCLDAAWAAWADAWMNKKPFTATSVGISYMLAGDGGASNIDPYAAEETPDNEWIVEGPHLMIIVPDAAALEALPTDPDNGGPYVMWKGTDYAHIMVPTTGK